VILSQPVRPPSVQKKTSASLEAKGLSSGVLDGSVKGGRLVFIFRMIENRNFLSLKGQAYTFYISIFFSIRVSCLSRCLSPCR
jgi:hypothetical protein